MKIPTLLFALLIGCPAAFAGEAKPSAPAPVKVVFKVTGMSCEGCAAKVTKKLATLPGVTVNRIDADDEVLDTTLDLTQSSKAQVIAAVAGKGYDITGEKLNLSITGMSCAACASKVKSTLAAQPGVTVESVSLKETTARVIIDPDKTDRTKIATALTAAGYGLTAQP